MVKTPLPPGTMLEVHFSVRRSVSKFALRSCIKTTPTLFPGVGFFTNSNVAGCTKKPTVQMVIKTTARCFGLRFSSVVGVIQGRGGGPRSVPEGNRTRGRASRCTREGRSARTSCARRTCGPRPVTWCVPPSLAGADENQQPILGASLRCSVSTPEN